MSYFPQRLLQSERSENWEIKTTALRKMKNHYGFEKLLRCCNTAALMQFVFFFVNNLTPSIINTTCTRIFMLAHCLYTTNTLIYLFRFILLFVSFCYLFFVLLQVSCVGELLMISDVFQRRFVKGTSSKMRKLRGIN